MVGMLEVMKPPFLCAMLLLAVLLPTASRSQDAPAERSYTKQDYEQAVQVLQRTVDGQKDRVQTVSEKLKATDDQIERRIARLVEYLSTITDSRESGTRVIRAKEDVLQGLKHSLDFYGRERDMRFAELARTSTRLAKEDLLDDVNRLNNRIEKRVEQVLLITMSLPEDKDVPQMLTTYAGDATTTSPNPEYTHNKMIMGRATQIRKKVHTALQDSIARLKRSNNELERAFPSVHTEQGEQVLRQFIDRNRELTGKREADIMRILSDSAPASKTLGSKAADEVVKQVQADRMEAKKDFNEWNRLKSDRDNERIKLRDYTARLAQYQKAVDTWKE